MKKLIVVGLMTLIVGCSTTTSYVKPVESDIWVNISYKLLLQASMNNRLYRLTLYIADDPPLRTIASLAKS